MKAKLLHLIANFVIWIALIAGLGGLVVALGLNIYTDYIPEAWHYIAIGAGMGVLLLVGIVLHIVAAAKARRERIRACWELVEDTDVMEAVEDEAAEEAVAEVVEEAEEPAEQTEETVEKTKIQIIREKIVEKTPLTAEQLEKVEKVGKVAVPVGVACITMLAMASKIKGYKAGEARRRSFYNWLG